MRFFLLVVSCLFIGSELLATGSGPVPAVAERWLNEPWVARWITHPNAPKNEFGVYLFRKDIDVDAVPEKFVVHVTADARYRLFVNGESVTFGPQRSDQWVWHYETVDLARWLKPGKNVIAARVWSYGEYMSYSIEGVRTGFLLQGDTEAESAVDTGESWRVTRDESWAPIPVKLETYIVIGPGNRVEAARHPWGWAQADYDAAGWSEPQLLERGTPYGWGADMKHWLRPRNLPLMEEKQTLFARTRRIEGDGVEEKGDGFVVPARSRATVLLDNGVETNAFPRLVVSGGKDGRVALTYAEAMVNEKGEKGNRDEVEGRRIVGVTDEFVADGGERREFGALDFRTYRYVQLEVETADEPLHVEEFLSGFTGYPFDEKGSFASDDASLEKIWEVGWRTARLCAFETYVDCPYYEQLQYVGDTRIQALISLYVGGDDRLMRNAIEQYDRSRIAEGLTQSRYPSVVPQVINTFSLFWVDMVHDYWMHRPDEAFVRERLAGVDAVLGWFERRIDEETGLLGPLKYWTFVDWVDDWKWNRTKGRGGEPPGVSEGGSAVVTLQLAGTLGRAAELWRAFGDEARAARYAKRAAALKRAVAERCWDEGRRMFADTPERRTFSQHANTFAVLSGAVEGDAAKDLMRRVADDREIAQASTYFEFYVLRAMKRAGLGDEYLARLGPWRQMLANGLTTFAEKLDPTRSDCHAWSASPVYEFLATVAGVEPGAPGFAKVRVEPHLGALKEVNAVVPHPGGEVRVALRRKGAGVEGSVALPEGVSGEFVWGGEKRSLLAGEQEISLPGK